jgi:NAD(P)-dependent dehydrogenase (short-subunit alcohol dehydrogenase family)
MEKVAASGVASVRKRDKVPHLYSAPMTTMTHFNQRVLITAAASGIGLAMADAFLAAGARVFICDVNPQTLQEALAARAALAGMVCDVSDEDQVADFFARGTAHLGGLDILVSNAGVAGPTANVEDIALADWRHCLAVNLDSAFLCAKLAAPLLRAQGSGSIINMSSTGGLFGFPRRAPYAAAKWAIRGLTRTLAQELGPAGVRVNCICPGSVAGDRMDRVIAAEAQQTGRSESAVRKEMTDAASLKTFILAEDIAQLALFITSPAGARISGQELTVDGHTETL